MLRPDFPRPWAILGHTFREVEEHGGLRRISSFSLNLVLDYGLLLVTARIATARCCGCGWRPERCLARPMPLLIFVPGLQFLSALPVRLCARGGWRWIAWRPAALFSSAGRAGRRTAALGGGVLA